MRRRSEENAMKNLFAWVAMAVCVAFTGAVLAQDKKADKAADKQVFTADNGSFSKNLTTFAVQVLFKF